MIGQKLHRYDLALCRHVLDNISTHLGEPKFSAFIEESMEPAVLGYMQALDDDVEPAPLLLSNEELEDLWFIFNSEEFPFDRDWSPYEALYRRSIDCFAEIREVLAKPYAEEWAGLCAQFGERLEARGVWLHHGIEIVREWVGELRRLLRAMGATNLLPAPEGASPTPTNPQPPQPQPTPTLPAPASPRADESLMAAVGEIRDLLLSQRAARDWYSTEEVARLLGRAEFTVREWCRNGRIHAEKKGSGRGKYQSWVVSHAELLRVQREGLLRLKR
jgi:hypothetical protein